MYTQEFIGVAINDAAALLDLTAAAVDGDARVFLSKVKVNRIAVCVTTAVVSTGAVVVAFKKRPTPGSTSGDSTIGSISIPAGTAVGKVYYKDISPAVLNAGDELVFQVTTAAAGGGAAGAGLPLFEGEFVGEMAANQSDMVASA
jgi:hypothetical protein